MTKAELESKHLAELHALAAEADVPRYRMLRREELIEQLAGAGGEKPAPRERARRELPPRRRREPAARREPAKEREPKVEREEAPAKEREAPPSSEGGESARPRRKRRRRRFGRKSKELRVHELLTPPPGRQALVYGESRSVCTALLREIAGELAGNDDGPDPIALLLDPSPEELADWKREAPEAELVVAAQARHASDALAQAIRRAEDGEDVILQVDSLTRLEDAEVAREIFDAALTQAKGTLTVVAALERSS